MRGYEKALLLVVACAVAWSAEPAAGQTRFEIPDTAVDLSTYATVEECVAAVDRVKAQERRRAFIETGTWPDTVPYDPAAVHEEPLPAAVGETARQCLGALSAADSVLLDDYGFFVPLYFHAGWEDRAWALLGRRLATVDLDDPEEMLGVTDTLTRFYQAVRPPRGELLDRVVEEYLPRLDDAVTRLDVYLQLVQAARTVEGGNNAPHTRKLVEAMIDFVASLDAREREAVARKHDMLGFVEAGGDVADRYRLAALVGWGYEKEGSLDSLRTSTAAFVRQISATRAAISGLPREQIADRMTIGKRMPAIEGDVWVGCEGPCGPRPTPGRVSLVMFNNHATCAGAAIFEGNDCAAELVRLRRLEERFPTLETTVASETHGSFDGVKEGVTPEKEAGLARQWLDAFGLRAALSMTEMPYWRLPDPDRRRINREVDRQANFGVDAMRRRGLAQVVLIDQDGLIVYTGSLVFRETESELAELIEVLLEREAAAS